MKRFLVLATLLLVSKASAQSNGTYVIGAPANTPINGLPTPGNSASGAVDKYGNLQVNISTTYQTPIPYAPAAPEMTGFPMIIVAATSVPTAFTTPNIIATPGLKSFSVTNTTDQDVYCALGGSVTPFQIVPSGSVWYENTASYNSKLSTGISCIHPSSTPSTGSIFYKGSN